MIDDDGFEIRIDPSPYNGIMVTVTKIMKYQERTAFSTTLDEQYVLTEVQGMKDRIEKRIQRGTEETPR